MKKDCALEIQKHILIAVEQLTSALVVTKGRCSDREYAEIKKAVGSAIGRIQFELLEPLYARFYVRYPEIDDLK